MSLHTAYFEEDTPFVDQLSNSNDQLDYDNNKDIELYNELKRQNNQQEKEIEEKEKLIITRNRMLQVAYEKNIFKKKILQTLIAIILAILALIVILIFYKT